MATKTLAKIKAEKQFNSDLTHLVDAMKGVAAAQYHIMEHRRTQTKKFPEALEEIFKSYDFRRSRSPFIRSRSEKRLIFVITTDGGFMGGLNMKVIQMALKYEKKDSRYLVIGERGQNMLAEFGKPLYRSFNGITTDERRFALVDEMIPAIYHAVTKDGFGQVILVSPMAVSFTVQRVEVRNLIPCPLFFTDREENVTPIEKQDREIIFESSQDAVARFLAVTWLRWRLIGLFEDAKLAEFGARTMHLEESYQTLKKQDKQLQLQYFKTRREKIDQSLRESFVSQLVCK